MLDLLDVLLLSVIVVTLYLGPMVLRRTLPGQRTYGWMLIVDLIAALVAFAAYRDDPSDDWAILLGVVAIGGAVSLVLVPPILRDLARRALAGDRLKLAKLVIDLRELLQPGMGAAQESELIETIIAVRLGHVDTALDRLRERRKLFSDPNARRHLDERIVMTLLYARRWAEAIGEFEGAHRDFSSTSPQLLVEMVRAYCEDEKFESAATLVEELESSPLVNEPVLASLVSRARLVFLAFVGRTGAVESIVGPNGPLGAMPEAARCFWSGIARLNAGDRSGARSSLSQAAKLSTRDSRARELAEKLLSTTEGTTAAQPRSVSPSVARLADRLTTIATDPSTARPQAPQMSGLSIKRHVPVTFALIAVNLAVSLLIHTMYGSTTDFGGLIRSGANVKAAVVAGEYWRLISSMFLHVGALHLFLNMYGLWILGRLVEQIYGSVRFVALFVVSGLVGALASVVVGGAATSAGASGAVFGLLGAAIAELALHRKAYPARWRSALLGNLVFLTIANVLIGFYAQVIDQAAHLGGLAGGAALAVLLSPHSKFSSTLAVRAVAAILCAASAVSLGYGAWGASTSDYSDSLARFDKVEREVGGLLVTVPETWAAESDIELMDLSAAIYIRLGAAEGEPDIDAYLDDVVSRQLDERPEESGFVRVAAAGESALKLPAGWESRELIATDQTAIGDQRYRIVLFARDAGDGIVWLGRLHHPLALTEDIEGAFADMLSSAKTAR